MGTKYALFLICHYDINLTPDVKTTMSSFIGLQLKTPWANGSILI